MKNNFMRTSVYFPIPLYEKAKKMKINFSELFRNALEAEIYQDDPKFIQKKMDEIKKKHIEELKTWEAKLLIAEEKQVKRIQKNQDPLLLYEIHPEGEGIPRWMPKRKIPRKTEGDK